MARRQGGGTLFDGLWQYLVEVPEGPAYPPLSIAKVEREEAIEAPDPAAIAAFCMQPMKRIVEPEWIDRLDPESPEAQRSRRELRRMNALMRNFDWFRTRLAEDTSGSWQGLEIGAGDGALGAHLFADQKTRRRIEFAGIDRIGRPASWPTSWQWVQEDILQFQRWKEFPLLIANMVLHHFSEDELVRLGVQIRESCRFLFALETARSPLHLAQARVLRTLGALGPVGYHDASTSIRAGFVGEELPQFLGLRSSEWRWRIRSTFFGAYQFVAERR